MDKKLTYIKEKLKGSFDVKYRELSTPLGKGTLVFIDDLCSTAFISQYIVQPLIEGKDINNLDELMQKSLTINLTGYSKDIEDAIYHVLSGDVIIIIENYEDIVYCETKGYVRRGVGIPLTESVLKGPREGFTEAMVDNVALMRRRIKNTGLKFEPLIRGEDTKTVVIMSYIEGLAPKDLIDKVRRTIEDNKINFILDTNYIEDFFREEKTLFDTVGYTEKPDEVCAKILEGRVAIIVDGTPFVVTLPFFFLENFQSPDDYYLNRYFANFTRVLRWLAFFIATLLPGLYVSILTYHTTMIPSMFIFRLAVSRAGVPFPTVIEVLLMMIFFQLIKEAGLRLPQPIGSAMSIVSALILGDAAVGAGLSSRITILIVAISTLCYFLIPKIYGAVSIWALIIVIISAMFGFPGFLIGVLVLTTHLCELKSINYAYLFPLGSVNTYKFKDVILRGKLKKISKKIVTKDEEYEEYKE